MRDRCLTCRGTPDRMQSGNQHGGHHGSTGGARTVPASAGGAASRACWPVARTRAADRTPARWCSGKPGLVRQALHAGSESRCLAVSERRAAAGRHRSAWVPLRMALRFHAFGRTTAARNLFSYFGRRLRARGPVATVKTVAYDGVSSAAMVYDIKPITDHFRRIDEKTVLGMMIIEGDPGPISSSWNRLSIRCRDGVNVNGASLKTGKRMARGPSRPSRPHPSYR